MAPRCQSARYSARADRLMVGIAPPNHTKTSIRYQETIQEETKRIWKDTMNLIARLEDWLVHEGRSLFRYEENVGDVLGGTISFPGHISEGEGILDYWMVCST